MSKFKVQTRPTSASQGEASDRGYAIAANRPSFGQRAAVFSAACALLIGVGAAGQASESLSLVAASDVKPAAEASAEANAKLQEAEIQAPPAPAVPQPAPAEISVAPQAAVPAPALAPAPAPAPVVAVNDPAGAQAYAAGQLGSYGWSAGQMQCLQTLWTKESDWVTTATNPSSGAYGIVQSLPAEKLASAGADYLTNYRTQINWGLNYIQERYQSPCGALNFHLSNNWY